MIESENTSDCLFFACSAIAKGILPTAAVKLLSSSWLIAIPKPNGDIRPIAVGEALRRITARIICLQKKESFAEFFSPIQFGVSTKCGSELIAHHISLSLQNNPEWIVLKTDVRNAFNSVSRCHLLEQVFQSFPDLSSHAQQMYGGFSSLVYMQGSTPVIISSEEGVHQGDPLGPALFAIAIHQCLTNLQSSYSKIRVLSYLDDVFLMGDPDTVLDAFRSLRESFSKINLEIAKSKCEIFSPADSILIPDSEGLPVSHNGSIFLGTPVGTPAFISSSCLEFAQSGDLLCEELTNLDDIQSSILLLRFCHVPRLNHLARTVAPVFFENAAAAHDLQTRMAFTHLIGDQGINDQVWQQAVLPIRLGGFGLTSVSSIACAAFVAAWSHSILELPLRFPDLRPDIDCLIHKPTGIIGVELHKSLPADKSISNFLTGVNKIQQNLSKSFFESEARCLVANAPTARDAARFRSLQGKGAGAWLNAIPTSYEFALNPREFRLASRLRLGLPISVSEWITDCNCGASLDDSGYHLLTCKTGGGPVWSHESLASVWSDCLKNLNIPHRREPRHRYMTSENRPDIVVFDSQWGANIELDVALAHPWSSDIFPKSSDVDGAAAKRREDRKEDKYKKERLPGGSQVNMIPLVMEHFGRWGEEARKYLRKLAQRSTDGVGRPNAAEFVDFWRKRFSVQLQRCNSRVILKKLSAFDI